MVTLMQRRREMMKMAASPTPTLITFNDRNYQFNTGASPVSYLNVSNGNHFKYFSRNRGDSYVVFANQTSTSMSNQASWPAIISLHSGDVVVVKMNGSVACGASSSYNGYAQFSLRDSSDTFVAGWTSTANTGTLYVVGGQTKTLDNATYTKTLTDDVDVTSLKFRCYGTAQAIRITLDIDFEMTVNGVRVI